ncbi:MAG: tetratricopeptide repeat protein [Deltaproteobacteria bacterium]|nr:tetratricopeptide repeat protein [Deltaproteobacteria bacterium]
MTKTLAEWFKEGVRCFHKPDGPAAIMSFEKVIDTDPAYRHSDGDNPYFYLGKISEMEERLEDAIGYYSNALSVDPHDEESLIGRGSCLSVRNEYDRAISDFEKVLDLDPNLRKVPIEHVYSAIAGNYEKKGDLINALVYGKKALEKDPLNYRFQEFLKRYEKPGKEII